MTLQEAFRILAETDLVIRTGRPKHGSYQIKWLKQLLEWNHRAGKPIGMIMRRFLAEDALASDWEKTMEYQTVFATHPDTQKNGA